MRLWHKDLLDVLPRKQLIGQWRECCLIAKNLKEKGTPNHLLVNRILDYPIEHFYGYCVLVYEACMQRGYKINIDNVFKYNDKELSSMNRYICYDNWHNSRYFAQCLLNLQEKYDCGGITDEEWDKILSKFNMNNWK